MQISDNLIKEGLAVLQQAPPAGQPRPAQPTSARPTPGPQAPPASAGAAAKNAPARLSTGGGLDDAVRTLKAEGRTPPRGSLVDLRV